MKSDHAKEEDVQKMCTSTSTSTGTLHHKNMTVWYNHKNTTVWYNSTIESNTNTKHTEYWYGWRQHYRQLQYQHWHMATYPYSLKCLRRYQYIIGFFLWWWGWTRSLATCTMRSIMPDRSSSLWSARGGSTGLSGSCPGSWASSLLQLLLAYFCFWWTLQPNVIRCHWVPPHQRQERLISDTLRDSNTSNNHIEQRQCKRARQQQWHD